jgi:glucosamine--fructose-6-phosphate aminotransferase (isomerizing)
VPVCPRAVGTLRRVSPTAEPDAHLREIREQPAAIRRAAEALLEQGHVLRDLGERSRALRIVLTGMGSSFDAGFPAVDHLAERGVVVLHANAAEILHFRLPWITAETVLVLVSQSGGSAEVVRLAERARSAAEPPLIVSLTNGLTNELAGIADIALDTRTGPETAPSSMTFAATLVQLGAIARAIGGDDPAVAATWIADAAARTSDAVQSLLDEEDTIAERIADVGRGQRTMVIVGRGAARATAEMGALTLQECGVVADGFEAGAFRHGPFELAGPRLGAIVVATERRTRSLELGLAGDLRATGSAVAVLTDEPDADAIVLAAVDRLLSPAVSMVPIQLGARRLAIEAGREPGSYAFATKVTTRE